MFFKISLFLFFVLFIADFLVCLPFSPFFLIILKKSVFQCILIHCGSRTFLFPVQSSLVLFPLNSTLFILRLESLFPLITHLLIIPWSTFLFSTSTPPSPRRVTLLWCHFFMIQSCSLHRILQYRVEIQPGRCFCKFSFGLYNFIQLTLTDKVYEYEA